MWDLPTNGTFIAPNEKRISLAKSLEKFSTEELKEAVKCYEEWMRNSYVEPFNETIINTIYLEHFSYLNNDGMLKKLYGMLEAYDVVCREIAKRWALSSL